MKKWIAAFTAVCMLAMFAGCAEKKSDAQTPESTAAVTEEGNTASSAAQMPEGAPADANGFDLTFTKKDLDGAYETAGSTQIVFSDSGAQVTGDGAQVSGGTVTLTAAGTYVVSGSTSDGRIHVAAGNSDDVKLVLNGLTLASAGAAITAESADKVILTLAENTVNKISDSSSYTLDVGGSNADAAIFAKTDLTINGAGSLQVDGKYKHGIVSKDSLAMTGGTIYVTAVNTGIEGKDCVKADNVNLTVDAGTDAIRSTNEERADRGFVYIAGGAYQLTAGSDGIQAETLLRVDGGTLNLVTGSGSANSAKAQSNRDMFARFGRNDSAADSTDSGSSKGLKSAANMEIRGGEIHIDSCDDALHANDTITIYAGALSLSSGDDGIHADNSISIQGGALDIAKSYEGIEASYITIDDGVISLVASDDGINISGGNDTGMGFDPFGAATDGLLTINGGYVYVNASGDGLDSNGSIQITGGVTLVSGPENDGNGALDYNGSAEITGGVLVAAGSSGMAQSVTGNGQGSIMTSINSQQGGVSVALTDASGNVIASFTPAKTYNNVVFSAPGIASGSTYQIVCGGTVSGADANGFAQSGTVSGGSAAASITMDSDNYGASSGMGMNPGGRGGQTPDRGMGGQAPDGNFGGRQRPDGMDGQRPGV